MSTVKWQNIAGSKNSLADVTIYVKKFQFVTFYPNGPKRRTSYHLLMQEWLFRLGPVDKISIGGMKKMLIQ